MILLFCFFLWVWGSALPASGPLGAPLICSKNCVQCYWVKEMNDNLRGEEVFFHLKIRNDKIWVQLVISVSGSKVFSL